MATELVVNGTFDSDLSGWTSTGGTVTWDSGVLRRSGTIEHGSYQNVSVTPGKSYRLRGTITNTGGGNGYIFIYDGNGFANSMYGATTSPADVIVTPTQSTVRIYLYWDGASGSTAWDNISLQEVPWAVGTPVGGAADVSPAWPGHVAGDMGLLFVESTGGQSAALSTPAGFAELPNSPSATGATTSGTRLTVYWCRATSSAMPAPTVSDPGNHAYAVIVVLPGVVDTGDPWDVTAAAQKASASTSASAPSVTTNVANAIIVNAIARDNDSAAAAFSNWANANLADLAEIFDAGTTLGNGGGLGIAIGTKATAGATGATTATVTSSINASMTIALKPASAGDAVLVDVPTAAAELADQAPTVSVSAHQLVAVPAAALVLEAGTPDVEVTTYEFFDFALEVADEPQLVEPPAGALSIEAKAPTVAQTQHQYVQPPAAGLAIDPADPTVVATAHQVVQVPAVAVEAEAAAPTVVATADVFAQPGAGQAQIQAYEPGIAVTNAQAVQVPSKALQASPQAPAVSTTANVLIDVPSASLAAAAGIPAVLATDHKSVAVPAVALQVDPADPVVAVSADRFVDVPLGAIDLVAMAPGIRLDQSAQVGAAGGLALEQLAPEVIASAHQSIAVPVAVLEVAGRAPGAVASNHVSVAVPAVSIGLHPLDPGTQAPDNAVAIVGNVGDLQVDAIDTPTVLVSVTPGVVKGHCVTARVLKRTARADVSARVVAVNVSKRTVGVSLEKC